MEYTNNFLKKNSLIHNIYLYYVFYKYLEYLKSIFPNPSMWSDLVYSNITKIKHLCVYWVAQFMYNNGSLKWVLSDWLQNRTIRIDTNKVIKI